jgi:hypothetical protein
MAKKGNLMEWLLDGNIVFKDGEGVKRMKLT